MIKILLISLLFFSINISSSKAKAYVAKVVKLRGTVSQLEPGSKISRLVKIGDKLREDSSILTGSRSFARIQFNDNSILNVGPRSKVAILESKKDGTSFIHLLKGSVRSRVIKAKSRDAKHKYYLKTRSAAMGVRGTDFQVVYNPENNVSSLLTYQGEVAMAKVEEDAAAELKRLKKIRRKQLKERKVDTDASGKVDVIESQPKYDLEGRMDQALATNEAVVVKPGQYSGTVNSIKRASLPVKVSPVQLNALYKNDEMNEKVKRSEVKQKSLTPSSDSFQIQSAEQDAPAEGIFKKETGEFAPRSGGVLDLNTGLYIPPENEAVYDAKLKVYVPKDNAGQIDSETGQYLAPKGLKLDPLKGFVASRKLKGDKAQILLAKADNLNKSARPKLWAGERKAAMTLASEFNTWSETEKISKDMIEVELFGYGESFESTNESGSTGRSLDSDNAKRLLIKWSHNSESNWQPTTCFGWKSTEYPLTALGSVNQPTRDGVMLGLGVRYNISKRWNFLSELMLEQEYYLDNESNGLLLKRVSIPKLKLGLEGPIFSKGRFSFGTHLYLMAALPKKSGNHKVSTGLGYGLDLLPRWWLTKKWNLYTGFSFEHQSQTVQNTGFKADNRLTKAGLKLGLGFLF